MVYTKKRKSSSYKGGTKSEMNHRDKNNMGNVKRVITLIKNILEDVVVEIHNKNKKVGVASTIVENINEKYIPEISLHNDDEMKDLVRKLTKARSYLLNTSINLSIEHVNISPRLKERIAEAEGLIRPKNVAFSLEANPNTELADILNQNAERVFAAINVAKDASAQLRQRELNRRESQTRALIASNGRRRSTHKNSHSKSSRSKSSHSKSLNSNRVGNPLRNKSKSELEFKNNATPEVPTPSFWNRFKVKSGRTPKKGY